MSVNKYLPSLEVLFCGWNVRNIGGQNHYSHVFPLTWPSKAEITSPPLVDFPKATIILLLVVKECSTYIKRVILLPGELF